MAIGGKAMSNRKAKPIRVYEFDQTSFNNNGICTLFPKSAVITRDLNEYKYYLDLTHPIDETGKWKEITEHMYMEVQHLQEWRKHR